MSSFAGDKQERFFFYNSLSILLKAVEGKRTTVDLRNESTVYGLVQHSDGFMNIVMKDCVFTDPRGDSFKYEMFFVQARNIRYVHIPTYIRIIPAIQEQLDNLSGVPKQTLSKHTFKSKRAAARQAEGLNAVHEILKKKEEKNS